MKVVYISNLPFADADFPLVREMQRQGIDVYYFIYVSVYSHRATLVDIPEVYRKQGIFPATVYEELKAYEGYMDMSKVFVINSLHQSDFHPANICTMLSLVRKIKKLGTDVVNITWPPRRNKMLLYLLRKKLVLTIHDPFPHSCKNNFEFEFCRKLAFKWIPKIVMLNDSQAQLFCSTYNFPKQRLFFAQLGDYDCIRFVNSRPVPVPEKFVLFFGLIAPYKGVEYLLEAFEKLHQKFPDVKLLVAGSGKLYFDECLYSGKDYIQIYNRYVPLEELSYLLENCLFTVCPYKDATQSGVIQTAYAKGTPVVATDVGNFSQMVEDGVTGKIVPACDENALARAMEELLENPSRLVAMKKELLENWPQKNGWEKIVKQYVMCYKA